MSHTVRSGARSVEIVAEDCTNSLSSPLLQQSACGGGGGSSSRRVLIHVTDSGVKQNSAKKRLRATRFCGKAAQRHALGRGRSHRGQMARPR
eukprot:scaffold2476_cov193-Amphora_coffeaeformis.AAC.11